MAGRAPTRRPVTPRSGGRFAILASRFNERITERLVEGARAAFAAAKVPAEDVEVFWVPGAFELPMAALQLARTGAYAGIACVGCVIRGETPHFEYVAGEAAAGIRQVACETGVPVTFGVITAFDEAQAWARAGGAVGHRGAEAADAALEMAEFIAAVRARRSRRKARRAR